MLDIIIEEIINENEELFTKREMIITNENIKLIKKIYLIGFTSAIKIYKRNLK